VFKVCLCIILNPAFQIFITLCIIGNIVALSFDRYPISYKESKIIEYMNLGFFVVFTVEMILKIVGLGFVYYFKEVTICKM
jgi:hypothetical protein